MIKKIFHMPKVLQNKNKVSKKKHLKTLPGDIFIVSYPRSGNTWLRFILANILYKDKEINFTNIHKYSPEVDKLKDYCAEDNIPRLIKSHEPYDPAFQKLVYLVRDGRDVYVSYYNYLSKTLPSGMTFKKFLQEFQMPYGYWNDHVLSWATKNDESFLLIKYEDMCLNTISTIHRVLNFINVKESDTIIQTALKKTTFNEMKNLEIKYGRGKYKSGPDVFMRAGKIGNWKNLFNKEEISLFKERENSALLKLGYEEHANWQA